MRYIIIICLSSFKVSLLKVHVQVRVQYCTVSNKWHETKYIINFVSEAFVFLRELSLIVHVLLGSDANKLYVVESHIFAFILFIVTFYFISGSFYYSLILTFSPSTKLDPSISGGSFSIMSDINFLTLKLVCPETRLLELWDFVIFKWAKGIRYVPEMVLLF